MGLRNPAPSRTATPQQLAQHARRLAEAADREASRLARAAPSDMPHAQTFFRSQSLSPGDGSDYLSPPSSLPTVAPVAANAAQDVVPETQALTGGDAAAGLFAAVAPERRGPETTLSAIVGNPSFPVKAARSARGVCDRCVRCVRWLSQKTKKANVTSKN